MTIVDLTRMRRHYADYREAWDRPKDQRPADWLMTIAAVLAAEDLGVLLDYLDTTAALPPADSALSAPRADSSAAPQSTPTG